MRKEHWMDDRAKSPDPDDLSGDEPAQPVNARDPQDVEEKSGQGEKRPNPDASTPHLPPPD